MTGPRVMEVSLSPYCIIALYSSHLYICTLGSVFKQTDSRSTIWNVLRWSIIYLSRYEMGMLTYNKKPSFSTNLISLQRIFMNHLSKNTNNLCSILKKLVYAFK